MSYLDLVRFYDNNSHEMIPLGFQSRPLHIVIEIDKQGEFVCMEELPDKTREAVTRQPKATGNWYKTCGLLCASATHVCPVDGQTSEKRSERMKDAHESFVRVFNDAFPDKGFDDGVLAVSRFLDKGDFASRLLSAGIDVDALYGPSIANGDRGKKRVTFRLHGDDDIIIKREAVFSRITEIEKGRGEQKIRCSVTGEIDGHRLLHDNITSLPFNSGKGGALISSNHEPSIGDGRQYPYIGNTAAHKIHTALEYLCSRGGFRFICGDEVIIWWSERKKDDGPELDHIFKDFIFFDNDETDSMSVKKKFLSMYTGRKKDGGSSMFNIMCIRPAGSMRATIKYHHRLNESDVARNISTFLDDLNSPFNKERGLGVRDCVNAQFPAPKKGDPNAEIKGKILTSMVSAIVQDMPLSGEIEPRVLGMVRAKGGPSFRDASVLRLVHNNAVREGRRKGEEMGYMKNDGLFTAFDRSKPLSYLLGGALSLTDAIQRASSPNVKRSASDTYFRVMMASPRNAYSRLRQNAECHLSSLRRSGKYGMAVFFEKKLTAVTSLIDGDKVPVMMTNTEQNLFIQGYDSMQVDRYTKKPESEANLELATAGE